MDRKHALIISVATGILIFLTGYLAGLQYQGGFERLSRIIRSIYPPPPRTPIIEESPSTPNNIETAYLSGLFRALYTFENPKHLYTFTVLVPRDPGKNDSTCGGGFSAGPCYLFIEPQFAVGAPALKFLGTVDTGNFDPKSVTFQGSIITFKTYFGDAGYSREAFWKGDAEKGTLEKVREVER